MNDKIQALTNVLYHLAEHPEIYLQPLRNEVEEVIAKLGWTKAALRDMVKIDSFVHESERFNGLSSCTSLIHYHVTSMIRCQDLTVIMTRKVANPKGFTFSNGVHLPVDTIVSVANYATHHDEGEYIGKSILFDFLTLYNAQKFIRAPTPLMDSVSLTFGKQLKASTQSDTSSCTPLQNMLHLGTGVIAAQVSVACTEVFVDTCN